MIKRLTLSALAALVVASSAVTLATASPASAADWRNQGRDWRQDQRHYNRDWRRDQRQANHDWRRDRNQYYGYQGTGYHNGQYRDRAHHHGRDRY